MDEIVVLSGKGGTGKTSLTAAFAHLSGNAVFCDLDVDAPDLHLLLSPQVLATHAFISGNEAVIDPNRCSGCGLCSEMCRFGAVSGTQPFRIDTLKCEGCKLCVALCPESAISFPEKHCGNWYRSKTRFGTMLHAQLFPGEENSGRLVALLRQEARRLAEAEGSLTILSDGPPGIGCPVISSLSGATLAAIVTEPTPSGIHDLKRILDLCTHFRVPASVLINKCDIDTGNTDAILDFLSDRG
ncbi:MAG: ATP-binding protein, partial [Desulfobacterales bacterium]